MFRTNACYARWDDSRKVWGDIINKCRTLVRQANTFMGDEYPGYGDFQASPEPEPCPEPYPEPEPYPSS